MCARVREREREREKNVVIKTEAGFPQGSTKSELSALVECEQSNLHNW